MCTIAPARARRSTAEHAHVVPQLGVQRVHMQRLGDGPGALELGLGLELGLELGPIASLHASCQDG